MVLIDLEVVIEVTVRFFYIGSSLIKRKREAIKNTNNLPGRLQFLIRKRFNTLCTTKEQLCAFGEIHILHFERPSERSDRIGTCGQQNTSPACLGKIFL